MFLVYYNSSNNPFYAKQSKEWYTGIVKPYIPLNNYVVKFEASNEELERIRNQFENIPICPTNTTMVWRGTMAQFIYDNL